jgi:hypothetical protein
MGRLRSSGKGKEEKWRGSEVVGEAGTINEHLFLQLKGDECKEAFVASLLFTLISLCQDLF